MTLYEIGYLLGVLLLVGSIAAYDRRRPRVRRSRPDSGVVGLTPSARYVAPQMAFNKHEPAEPGHHGERPGRVKP